MYFIRSVLTTVCLLVTISLAVPVPGLQWYVRIVKPSIVIFLTQTHSRRSSDSDSDSTSGVYYLLHSFLETYYFITSVDDKLGRLSCIL